MSALDTALLEAYYARRNARPVVGFYVGEYFPLRQYRAAAGLPQGPFGVDDVARLDWRPDYERLYALHSACPGDLLYTATAFVGVPWMEAALGCPVVADHETGSCRALPAVGPGEWPALPAFTLDNPWVALCLRLTRDLAAQAAGRFALGVTLMRGVADVLGALLGLQRLVYALVDDPCRVEALAAQVAAFWVAFAQAQLDAMPCYAGGVGSLYGLWAPGRCAVLQEDNAALLSPKLYTQYIYPHDVAIAAAFDRCIFHLHPARYIPYRPLLDAPVAVVELHLDRGGPSARKLLPVYREILASKPLLVWGDCSADDLQVLRHELPPQGLALSPVVSSPEEAWALWEALR